MKVPILYNSHLGSVKLVALIVQPRNSILKLEDKVILLPCYCFVFYTEALVLPYEFWDYVGISINMDFIIPIGNIWNEYNNLGRRVIGTVSM